ncbi:hypothetical protein QL285_056624 [Trifolium repens]|nr:hypothetical protein QL285_056624 [Trifolium repens]
MLNVRRSFRRFYVLVSFVRRGARELNVRVFLRGVECYLKWIWFGLIQWLGCNSLSECLLARASVTGHDNTPGRAPERLSTVNTTAILPQIVFIPIDFIPKSQSILPQIDSTSHNPFSSNSKQRTIQLSASVLLKKRVHYKTVTNPSPIERNTIPVFLSTKRYSVLFRFYSRKIKLQDIIEKDGQPSSEVFQSIVGKEKPGRMRCHGRTTTLTLLKRNEEIAKLKREHADEVKRLTQEVEEKRRQDKEEIDKKLKLLFKAIMNQNVANFDMDAIAALISAPTTDANSEFHSLTSTHAPNDNEMMNNDDINEDIQDFEDEE